MFKKLLIFLLLFSNAAFASQSRNLTIFAEPNIAVALTKIARQYSRAANVIVALNFTSASSLMNNIDSGEPVDLFISANSNWIETLHQKGVVDIYNVGYIAQDELVLATQKDNTKLPHDLVLGNISNSEIIRILDENRAKIIIDEPNNSSGFFARKFLERFHFENISVFSRISEDKIPLLKTIKSDKENYSILLQSQIHNKDNFRVITKSDQKIFYQALVIAGDNMEVAREFLKFLKSPQSKNYLRSYGFIIN